VAAVTSAEPRSAHQTAERGLLVPELDITDGRCREADERAVRTRIVAAGLLDEAIDELASATAELRELARGIHPVVLTEGGLEPALAGLAARAGLPVTITGSPPERLPAHVEATTYFVVAALGGVFAVASPPGDGTTVQAELPCAS
jgi:xanthine/CO dehydrogenase XdhC/CoxF family maturation factor